LFGTRQRCDNRPLFLIPHPPDAETLKREEEAIQLDGLNVAQLKEIREKVGSLPGHLEGTRMTGISFPFFLCLLSVRAGGEVYFPNGGQPHDEVDHQLALPQQGDLPA